MKTNMADITSDLKFNEDEVDTLTSKQTDKQTEKL